MQQNFCSDDVIETIVNLNCGQHASAREKHVLRESLRNLVRIAKIEEAGTVRVKFVPTFHSPNVNVLH